MKKYSKIFHQTSSGFKSLVWTNIIKTVFICSKHIISQCRLCISLKLEIKLDIQKFIIQGGDPYLPPVCHQGETGRGPRKSHIVLFLAVTSVTILLVLTLHFLVCVCSSVQLRCSKFRHVHYRVMWLGMV